MKRNNFFSRVIVVTLLSALLLFSGGRAIPVSALAVGPLADPVYDTEIIAFKDYVEQNLDAPQLDIMFFLIGGLAVAQMGAQDAMLISPYPNEENVKEWIINCGIQLYNSVIGLVPEGDYYMGIPSLGTSGTKGVPRQTIKALVAQMMGDAVVAINYPDLDTFLEENPDQLFIPFNKDLQLGVNAIFGLNGGIDVWQSHNRTIGEVQGISWKTDGVSQENIATILTSIGNQGVRFNVKDGYYLYDYRAVFGNFQDGYGNLRTYSNLFINSYDHTVTIVDNSGNVPRYNRNLLASFKWGNNILYNQTDHLYFGSNYYKVTYPSSLTTVMQVVEYYFQTINNINLVPLYEDFIQHIYQGVDWAGRTEVSLTSNLNLEMNNIPYYQQVTNDYLLDLRGLMGDLVNYVYVRNPVWDNIYDLLGNIILPSTIDVSVDLTPITDLLAPPVPVNMNEIAELTDNTYLERVKEHARNAGDIFANYIAFWHNCDSDLVYTMFGAVILVLVGAFVGKWGHS